MSEGLQPGRGAGAYYRSATGPEYAYFGCDPAPDNLFVYTAACLTSSRRPFIVVRLNEERIDWFYGSDPSVMRHGEIPPPRGALFSLPLSGSVLSERDVTYAMARAFFHDVAVPQNARDGEAKGPMPVTCRMDPTGGYSQLAIWHINETEYETWAQKLTCSRLFLDFLYDLCHSKVFTTFPRRVGLERRLLDHPLIRAIHAKAEYYLALNEPGAKECAIEDKRQVWVDYCLTATGQAAVESGGGWFSDLESEIQQAVLGQLLVPCDPVPDRERRRLVHFGSVVRWLLARYHFNAALEVTLRHLSGRVLSRGVLVEMVWWVAALLIFFLSFPLWRQHVSFLAFVPPLPLAGLAGCLVWLTVSVWRKKPLARLAAGLARSCKWIWRQMLTLVAWLLHSKREGDDRKQTHTASGPYMLSFDRLRPATAVVGAGLTIVAALIVLGECGAFEVSRSQEEMALQVWSVCALLVLFPLILILPMLWEVSLALGRRFLRKGSVVASGAYVIRLALPRLLFALVGAWLAVVCSSTVWGMALFANYKAIFVSSVLLMALPFVFVVARVDRMVHSLMESMRRASLLLGFAVLMSLYIGAVTMGLLGERTLLGGDVLDAERLEQNVEEHFQKGAVQERKALGLVPKDAGGEEPKSQFSKRQRFAGLREVKIGYTKRLQAMYALNLAPIAEFHIYPIALLYLTSYVVFVALFLQLVAQDREMTEPL